MASAPNTLYLPISLFCPPDQFNFSEDGYQGISLYRCQHNFPLFSAANYHIKVQTYMKAHAI